MSNESRSSALTKLAQAHEIHRGDQNSSGEDYGAYLDNPETIREWAAVTRSPETGITYLTADFLDGLSAKRYAARHIGDDVFEELPVEVVNLDTGQSRSHLCWRRHGVRWGRETQGAAAVEPMLKGGTPAADLFPDLQRGSPISSPQGGTRRPRFNPHKGGFPRLRLGSARSVACPTWVRQTNHL